MSIFEELFGNMSDTTSFAASFEQKIEKEMILDIISKIIITLSPFYPVRTAPSALFKEKMTKRIVELLDERKAANLADNAYTVWRYFKAESNIRDLRSRGKDTAGQKIRLESSRESLDANGITIDILDTIKKCPQALYDGLCKYRSYPDGKQQRKRREQKKWSQQQRELEQRQREQKKWSQQQRELEQQQRERRRLEKRGKWSQQQRELAQRQREQKKWSQQQRELEQQQRKQRRLEKQKKERQLEQQREQKKWEQQKEQRQLEQQREQKKWKLQKEELQHEQQKQWRSVVCAQIRRRSIIHKQQKQWRSVVCAQIRRRSIIHKQQREWEQQRPYDGYINAYGDNHRIERIWSPFSNGNTNE